MNQSVSQVKAWDKDLSSPNNKVVYRIQSGAGDKFVIEPETGTIRVAPGSNLDPDLTVPKTTRYSLKVLAIDSGTDVQRSAEVFVNITIIDVNNKPPVFVDPGTVTIRENTQVSVCKIIIFLLVHWKGNILMVKNKFHVNKY